MNKIREFVAAFDSRPTKTDSDGRPHRVGKRKSGAFTRGLEAHIRDKRRAKMAARPSVATHEPMNFSSAAPSRQ